MLLLGDLDAGAQAISTMYDDGVSNNPVYMHVDKLDAHADESDIASDLLPSVACVARCRYDSQVAERGSWTLAARRHEIRAGLTGGPLDRVAQIAERKYCRPQARLFGLGFPRKVPVFPICAPAAL
jgi:hypothetical protein